MVEHSNADRNVLGSNPCAPCYDKKFVLIEQHSIFRKIFRALHVGQLACRKTAVFENVQCKQTAQLDSDL